MFIISSVRILFQAEEIIVSNNTRHATDFVNNSMENMSVYTYTFFLTLPDLGGVLKIRFVVFSR